MDMSYAPGGAGTSEGLPVVILAGGEGRRLGGGKPARLLGGRTLLEHALGLARGWSEVVAVAVRAPIPAGEFIELRDDPAIGGPLAGVVSGMRFAVANGFEAVMTIPCDSPFLPADLPERLAAALAPNMYAAAPESGGQLHPACALWRVELIDRLDAYLRSGRNSLLGLIEQAPHARVAWPAEPLDPFVNINSPSDLDAAERRLKSRARR